MGGGPMFGTVRVRSRLRRDGRRTTWAAWDTTTGERVLLRTFPDGLPFLPPGAIVSREGGLHARTAPFVCSLADLDPLRTRGFENTTLWSATVLLSVLHALLPIHAAGHTHGWIGPESVVATRDRWSLARLGPVDAPTDDLRAIGRLLPVADPLTELVADFADHPPPSVADALRMVGCACAHALAVEHHAIVVRARALGRSHGRTRLSALVHRLVALPPPTARGVVQIGADALEVVSEGGVVRASRGPSGGPFDQGFVVAGPDGPDPVASRAVLRAIAAAPSPALVGLARWLGAAVQLRTDRMLLEREAG